MRKVAQIMGMPISVDIPDCDSETVFEKVFTWFEDVDKRFSTYKEDSEVSRYRSGELTKPSRQLELIIEACRQAENATGGYFSAWAAGSFDPSGYVKGWAIDEAGKIIIKEGHKTFCIGAGGDILARSDSDKEWGIGIQNPTDRNKIIGVIRGKNFAAATSGNYERGEHIINPKTGLPAADLLSITLTGPDIITADVLATAGFVAGRECLKLLEQNSSYGLLAIDNKNEVLMSRGMGRLLQAP